MKNISNIESLIKDIETYQDDPNELSKVLIGLSAQLFWIGSELADSQLLYSRKIVKILNGEKKISVAQAEREADVLTECEHDHIRYEKDAILEMMNSIKARLRVFPDEKNNSNI